MAIVVELQSGTLPEMIIIEMQGNLVPNIDVNERDALLSKCANDEERLKKKEELQAGDRDRSGKHVGELTVDEHGNPNIVMGNRTIIGEFVVLKKPLALVKKTRRKRPLGSNKESVVCEVQGVCRRKALFTTRPSIHIPPELVKPVKEVKKGKRK